MLHSVNIDVVPKTRFGADAGDARLFRIDFPGVKIEDGGQFVCRIDMLNHPARQLIGHEPEIATAAGRPVPVEKTDRGWRNFEKLTNTMRVTGCIGHAVVVVANGVNTRTVVVTGTFQTFKSPQVLRTDRETWRPVASDLESGQIFKNQLGDVDIGEKCFR